MSTTDDLSLLWEIQLNLSHEYVFVSLISFYICVFFRSYNRFIEKCRCCIPPQSCWATHLRLVCRFRKLATSLKFFPAEKKEEKKRVTVKKSEIRQHVRQFPKLIDEEKHKSGHQDSWNKAALFNLHKTSKLVILPSFLLGEPRQFSSASVHNAH